MRILFDTSVLVAAFSKSHTHHPQAFPWLHKAKAGEFEFLVAAHTLAEVYSVLTRLPLNPKVTPATAWSLIHENLLTSAEIVALSEADYLSTIRRTSDQDLAGGMIYDALLVRAAEKSRADQLLTFNERHFRRIWPEGASVISIPE